VSKVGEATGRCGKCGKTYSRLRPASVVYCDCWKRCPYCGNEMSDFDLDLSVRGYKRGDLDVVKYCASCKYKSKLMPVEVELE